MRKTLLIFFAAWCIAAFAYLFNKGGEEIYPWEWIILMGGSVQILFIFFPSIIHALYKKRYGWGVLILFIWPVSYIYLWKYCSGSE
jgi:hypothetical protein